MPTQCLKVSEQALGIRSTGKTHMTCKPSVVSITVATQIRTEQILHLIIVKMQRRHAFSLAMATIACKW